MVVLDQATALASLLEVARAAIDGGADIVQVREPGLLREKLQALVREVIAAVGDAKLVSINGEPEMARELATNLHLPERIDGNRCSINVAPAALLGRSIHSDSQAWSPGQVDYVVLGHLFETASKPGNAGLGVERFRQIARVVPVPVLAIGGMRPDTIDLARAAGANGVAVGSYVNAAIDPERAASEIRIKLDQWAQQ